MILSNVSIQEAIDEDLLVIDPEPQPRDGDSSPYNTSAVDLRLGSEISEFVADAGLTIDLTRGNFRQLFARNSRTRELLPDQPFCLGPQRMVLGKTLERVAFPMGDKRRLAARVEGKSSYARCGLLVHFTAPTIHAGFEGTITLEMINLGPLAINLHAHMPICQLIIEEVTGSPRRMDSQFQGQTTTAGG